MIAISPPPIRLSPYTNLDSEGNPMLPAHAYQAQSAGSVTVYATTDSEGVIVASYVGLTNDPEGAGDMIHCDQTYKAGAQISQGCLVAKGEYFEITNSSGVITIIRWKSFGILKKPVDNN